MFKSLHTVFTINILQVTLKNINPTLSYNIRIEPRTAGIELYNLVLTAWK
jgi:hypothetical protein